MKTKTLIITITLLLSSIILYQQTQIQQLQQSIQNINSDHIVQQWLIEHYGVSSIDELVQQKLKEYGVQYAGNPFTTALYPGQLQAENITGMHWYTYKSGSLLNRTDVIAYPEQTASYIIFGEDTDNDGVYDIIYAKNCTTGQIEFQGTDAATVIQHAINQLTNGGKIFIKNGVYVINTEIKPKSNIHIFGEGDTTILRQGDDRNLQAVVLFDSVQNASIQYVSVNGNKDAQTSTNTAINHGIQVTNSCRNIKIAHNHVHDAKNLGICVFGGDSENYSIGVEIVGNIVHDNGRDGIALDDYHSRILIVDNIVYDNPDFLIGTARYVNNVIIGRNLLFFTKVMPTDNPREAILISIDCYNIEIIDNLIVNPEGLNLAKGIGTASSAYNILISGNMIYGTLSNAIEIRGSNLHVCDNWLNGGYVINIHSEAQDIKITNNYILPRSYTGGIALGGANILITDNYIKNPSPTANYGIQVNNPTGAIVTNNYFDPTLPTKIDYVSGTIDVIKGNINYVTENSGSVEFSGTTVSFAHGLAGTPTGVWASFNSTGYGGWTWTANSTHITITVANSGSYTVYWRAEYQP